MSAPARVAGAAFPAGAARAPRRPFPVVERLRLASGRHPGSALAAAGLLLIALLALLGPAALPVPDPDAQALRSRLQPPLYRGVDGTLHLAGTDQLGRDVLSRTIAGARLSLGIAFSTVLLSGIAGSLIGLFVGFRGGVADFVAMRWVDLQMAVPPLLLAIFLLYLIGSSITNLVALLVFFAWVGYARVVRAETMRLRSAPFVESAVVAGASEGRILLRHIFPQLLPVLVAIAVVEFAAVILAEAGLSFLGFGVQPPDSSWGRMVADGQAFITTGAWWLFAVPGAAIFVTVLLARLAAPWVQSICGAEPDTGR